MRCTVRTSLERKGIQEWFTGEVNTGTVAPEAVRSIRGTRISGIGRTVPVHAVTEMEERIEDEVMEERKIFPPRNAQFEDFPGCAQCATDDVASSRFFQNVRSAQQMTCQVRNSASELA